MTTAGRGILDSHGRASLASGLRICNQKMQTRQKAPTANLKLDPPKLQYRLRLGTFALFSSTLALLRSRPNRGISVCLSIWRWRLPSTNSTALHRTEWLLRSAWLFWESSFSIQERARMRKTRGTQRGRMRATDQREEPKAAMSRFKCSARSRDKHVQVDATGRDKSDEVI